MTIDELVVTLSLDPTKFREGTKEGEKLLRTFRGEAKKAADDSERSAAKMADGFSRVTKELLGLGLAITGANSIKNLVVGTVQAADAQGRLAAALGVTVERYSAWVNLARRAGVDQGAASAGISALRAAAQGVAEGSLNPNAAGQAQMAKLGLTSPDWGNWEHLAQQLVQAFDPKNPLIANAPGARITAAQAIPGGDTFLQIANQFKASDLAKELAASVTATHEQAAAARDLVKAFTELQLAIEKKINQLIPEAAPEAKKVMSAAQSAVGGDFGPALDLDTEVGKNVAGGFNTIGNWIKDAFVRHMIEPDKWHKWVSTGDARGGPQQEFGPWPNTSPEWRNLPREGFKNRDRFPGLGPGASSGSAGGSVDNSRTVRIDAVHLSVPPGTRDPQAFADRFTSAVSAIEAQQGSR